jgi:hypothetical protein
LPAKIVARRERRTSTASLKRHSLVRARAARESPHAPSSPATADVDALCYTFPGEIQVFIAELQQVFIADL